MTEPKQRYDAGEAKAEYKIVDEQIIAEKPKRLTKRQRVFIDEYLKSGNATKSALAAGYSTKTAYSHGARLTHQEDIEQAIDRRIAMLGIQRPEQVTDRRINSKSSRLYLIQEDFLGLVKIGIATDVMSRIRTIQISCPQNITILDELDFQCAQSYETSLHARYSSKHFRGEWFRLTETDIEDIRKEWQNLRQNAESG
jgi:hypothetical protein